MRKLPSWKPQRSQGKEEVVRTPPEAYKSGVEACGSLNIFSNDLIIGIK
jgi:hypothetical protein